MECLLRNSIQRRAVADWSTWLDASKHLRANVSISRFFSLPRFFKSRDEVLECQVFVHRVVLSVELGRIENSVHDVTTK